MQDKLQKQGQRSRWIRKWIVLPNLILTSFMVLYSAEYDLDNQGLWFALAFLNLGAYAVHSFIIRAVDEALAPDPAALRQKEIDKLYGRDS